jgi:hypothetical protein
MSLTPAGPLLGVASSRLVQVANGDDDMSTMQLESLLLFLSREHIDKMNGH